MVLKAMGGAALGVTIPIVVEYGAKGARLMDAVKYSGLVGIAEGVAGGLVVIGSEKGWWMRDMSDDNKAAIAAFAGGGLATGVSIIILDELRKRALYTFKQGRQPPREIPLTEEAFPRMQERTPTAELVEEI